MQGEFGKMDGGGEVGAVWTRRNWLRTCMLRAAGALVVPSVYAVGIEPHWWEKVERELPIEFLPDEWVGRKVVQLSDLHIGKFVSQDYLRDVFREVSSWDADLVLYTGDFITLSARTREKFLELLPFLPRGVRATVASFGNHDYGWKWREKSWADWLRGRLATREISVLVNEMEVVDGLQLIGMGETLAYQFDPELALQKWRKDVAALVLSHNPDTVDERNWGGYRGWVLSGHTHGGQCRVPGFEPPILPVKNRRYVAGHVVLADGRNLYINRGIGHSLPIRFGVRPEVTLFTLVRA